MAQPEKPILETLKGCELSAVTFVRDYVQLQFDGPFLNCFVLPRVTVSETTFSSDSPGYRDALCGQIGKTVAGAAVEDDVVFHIFFADGSLIEISLRPEDRPGPEAVELQDGNRGFGVW